MSNFIDRISDLADLEAKASPGPWEYESQESGFSEEIIGYMTKPDLEDMLNGKDCDVALACALRNKALPLLKEIQGALLEEQHERQTWEVSAKANETVIDSQNEQISFLMGANSAFVQEIESLRAENKQLKENIAQAEQFIGLIESHGLEYALSKVVKA